MRDYTLEIGDCWLHQNRVTSKQKGCVRPWQKDCFERITQKIILEMRISKMTQINQQCPMASWATQKKPEKPSPTFKTLQVLLSASHHPLKMAPIPKEKQWPLIVNYSSKHRLVTLQECLCLWKSGELAWGFFHQMWEGNAFLYFPPSFADCASLSHPLFLHLHIREIAAATNLIHGDIWVFNETIFI